MYFLKTLFFNFLAVFFANHILPGIEVVDQTKLPHLGADLPFALALGLLNSLIFPVMKLIKTPVTILKIAVAALLLNLFVYAIVKFFPIGIDLTLMGMLYGSIVVSIGSFLTNYLEMKHSRHAQHSPDPSEPPPPSP